MSIIFTPLLVCSRNYLRVLCLACMFVAAGACASNGGLQQSSTTASSKNGEAHNVGAIDYPRATYAELEVLAKNGDPIAQYHFALFFKGGAQKGNPSHKTSYLRWLTSSAEGLYTPAIRALAGDYLDTESPIRHDIETGYMWWFILLELGDKEEQRGAGWMIEGFKNSIHKRFFKSSEERSKLWLKQYN